MIVIWKLHSISKIDILANIEMEELTKDWLDKVIDLRGQDTYTKIRGEVGLQHVTASLTLGTLTA